MFCCFFAKKKSLHVQAEKNTPEQKSPGVP